MAHYREWRGEAQWLSGSGGGGVTPPPEGGPPGTSGRVAGCEQLHSCYPLMDASPWPPATVAMRGRYPAPDAGSGVARKYEIPGQARNDTQRGVSFVVTPDMIRGLSWAVSEPPPPKFITYPPAIRATPPLGKGGKPRGAPPSPRAIPPQKGIYYSRSPVRGTITNPRV
jgi:hypothetical protein